ncbi:poly alpha-glucosyltransferase [Acinetobacter sp. MD2(2019)]|uniref:poly alpha-glucosyltransferase n=1 Tax=Acinetobacter sp. MD2(2019) TaxID=2605273 RepID=UPI002D1E6028|nr:poly alpha-glucosyltransferase [Acinetobacter sp. MD2(2019)]MEB3754572.1 poly alpha-glucosyltransferase [Acinetobacter sp. MD2(2019)]
MTIRTYSELLNFKNNLVAWIEETVTEKKIEQERYVLFFSYGRLEQRCQVWESSDANLKKLIQRLLNFIEKLYKKNSKLMDCVKIDIPYNIEKISGSDFESLVHKQPHNNHMRKGFSLDENFQICFLEQEIYGKSIIKGVVYNEPNFLDEKNLNDAIQKKYPTITKKYSLNELKDVWLFDTFSAFFENNKIIDLQSQNAQNGIRIISENKKEHITQLIKKNAEFLHNQIQKDGRFIYGYFSAYNREINSYNTVRHCTALYSLLETLEIDYRVEYLDKIKASIQYAIDHFYREVDGKGFMIDGGEDALEIKLGSNATAIFMFAKYQEITKDAQFIEYAEKLAEGIRYMVDEHGETSHVLHYPSLEVKEKFRIVYYDGEAALGLLRLYQINKSDALLATVKLMFEHFINKKYDKYHDHWLSYCTNELTLICPEEKYFQFGINNYLKHMDFIKNRKTAYATFLEMMMAAYKMLQRLKLTEFQALYASAKVDELKELIELRVEFQRSTGFFYPEIAMYMAKPNNILNSFYVRHDRFRVRIDDQEHNLSGYVAYVKHFYQE